MQRLHRARFGFFRPDRTGFGRTASLLIALLVCGGAEAADSPLSDAAKRGDRDTVLALIGQQADVNVPAVDGTTALHWAVYHNDLELATRLLNARADVNVKNRYDVPPLALACTNANPRMVDLLLEAGADPKAAPAGEPVLMTAARTGNVDAVKALLGRGAEVNTPEPLRGQTALMWAAIENHPAVVRHLLENGADVHARSKAGSTSLMFAAREGHLETARILVESGADVNQAMPNGATVLMLAIDNLRYPVAAFLLEKRANPNAINKQGEAALHAAVRGRAPTRRRRPVDELQSADLLQRLLVNGANPNTRTPQAPRITDDKVASSLRPAIDNVVNLGGATPFLLAAQAADVKAMRILLEHGADPSIATYENTTTLMIAAGVGFVEGREKVRPESEALAAVKMLAEAGVDVNAVNARGQTALHGAVYRAGNTIIEFLLKAGARTDVQDELGRTALKLAETGFNQVSSVIRRESSAALLRSLTSTRLQSAR